MITDELGNDGPFKPVDEVAVMLNERQKTHGHYSDHAAISQKLKDTFIISIGEEKWRRMTDTQRESVEMIFHKLGRIGAGDPNFVDHWDDIAGYARIANYKAPTLL